MKLVSSYLDCLDFEKLIFFLLYISLSRMETSLSLCHQLISRAVRADGVQ